MVRNWGESCWKLCLFVKIYLKRKIVLQVKSATWYGILYHDVWECR